MISELHVKARDHSPEEIRKIVRDLNEEPDLEVQVSFNGSPILNEDGSWTVIVKDIWVRRIVRDYLKLRYRLDICKTVEIEETQ